MKIESNTKALDIIVESRLKKLDIIDSKHRKRNTLSVNRKGGDIILV